MNCFGYQINMIKKFLNNPYGHQSYLLLKPKLFTGNYEHSYGNR